MLKTTAARNRTRAKQELARIYTYYRPYLGASSNWEFEQLRWHELIFCLLSTIAGRLDYSIVRQTTNSLAAAGFLEVKRLSSIASSKKKFAEMNMIKGLMTSNGFTKSQAERSISMLVGMARVLNKKYNGQIQLFLRAEGEQLVRDAQEALKPDIVSKPDFEYATRLWLQNILNLPITLQHPAVQVFCNRFKISSDELAQISDELDVNLAVVDDLLILSQYDSKNKK